MLLVDEFDDVYPIWRSNGGAELNPPSQQYPFPGRPFPPPSPSKRRLQAAVGRFVLKVQTAAPGTQRGR